MASDALRESEIYLQLARKSDTYGRTNYNSEMTVVSTTTKPPTTRKAGTVVVKLRLIVPDKAFDPAAIPALVAEIPLDLLHPPQDQIEVVIDDANS
jgi:hypothetical protein